MADWLKDVSAAFEKIGEGAKELAEGARKTVGIGVGSVHLDLHRFDFHPGDTIRGTLRIELTEDTPAKRVVVALIATRRRTRYEKRSSGGSGQTIYTEQLYALERKLAGAGTYKVGHYPFELVVPSDAVHGNPEIRSDGWIGDVARVVSSIASATQGAITWRLVGFVDVPWRRNVKTTVDLSVTQ